MQDEVEQSPRSTLSERAVRAILTERAQAIAQRDRYREALIQMDEAICHGNPETAKRIAREAYGDS
jgi:hypothetical protein